MIGALNATQKQFITQTAEDIFHLPNREDWKKICGVMQANFKFLSGKQVEANIGIETWFANINRKDRENNKTAAMLRESGFFLSMGTPQMFGSRERICTEISVPIIKKVLEGYAFHPTKDDRIYIENWLTSVIENVVGEKQITNYIEEENFKILQKKRAEVEFQVKQAVDNKQLTPEDLVATSKALEPLVELLKKTEHPNAALVTLSKCLEIASLHPNSVAYVINVVEGLKANHPVKGEK